jgi:hypothetical protein
MTGQGQPALNGRNMDTLWDTKQLILLNLDIKSAFSNVSVSIRPGKSHFVVQSMSILTLSNTKLIRVSVTELNIVVPGEGKLCIRHVFHAANSFHQFHSRLILN